MKRFLPIFIGAALACTESQARQSANSSTHQTTVKVEKDKVMAQADQYEFPINTRKKLSVAMVQASSYIHIYLEGQSGVRRVDAANTFWVKNTGIAHQENQALHITEADGHDYYIFSNKKPPLLTTMFKDAKNGNARHKIVVEISNTGKYINYVEKAVGKKRIKLATTNKKPVKQAVLTVLNPTDINGKPSPKLTRSELPQIRKGKAIMPNGAQIIKRSNLSKSEQKSVAAKGRKIMGSSQVLFSTKLNLDRDAEKELFVCVKKTGKLTKAEKMTGPTRCFVQDTIDGEVRWYSTGITSSASISTFKTANGRYLVSQNESGLKGLRFDGSGYTFDMY